MKRVLFVIGTLGGTLGAILLNISLAAQAPTLPQGGGGRGGPPQPPQNLQVLPKDSTIQQVLPVMQGFAQGLGVECGHCHVTQAAGAPANDFAADAKPEKSKARVMLRMVQTINQTIGSQLGKPAAEVTQVQCVTCHRGVPIPKQLVDIVIDTASQTNVAAALAKYRDLRKQFYGAQSYDFSDGTLFLAAQRANTANRTDDAIEYATLNLEFNPTSARSHQVISQAYQRKGDMPKAIASMEKAISLEPTNVQFQNQLNNLKNPQTGRGQAPGQGPGPGPGRGQ